MNQVEASHRLSLFIEPLRELSIASPEGPFVAGINDMLCLCLGVRAQVDSLTQDGIVRVLAIGNSFSQDAVEQYLWELANEVGVKMIIGNAYRGGQGFQSHWIDVTEANNTFEYRKVVNGRRTNKPRTALSEIITDEPWQYITFQQVSQESGLTTTFEPYLTYLIQYAQGLQTNPNAAYGYHQTWAYSHDSTSCRYSCATERRLVSRADRIAEGRNDPY